MPFPLPNFSTMDLHELLDFQLELEDMVGELDLVARSHGGGLEAGDDFYLECAFVGAALQLTLVCISAREAELAAS